MNLQILHQNSHEPYPEYSLASLYYEVPKLNDFEAVEHFACRTLFLLCFDDKKKVFLCF